MVHNAMKYYCINWVVVTTSIKSVLEVETAFSVPLKKQKKES